MSDQKTKEKEKEGAQQGAQAATPAKVAIRFLKPHTPYNSGEVCGKPPDVANDLVKRGIAELVNTEAKK